jgi:hypothetical protein
MSADTSVWNPDCGHAWCVNTGVKWGMYSDWGDQRVSLMVERAANLAASGSAAPAVLDWIRGEMDAMSRDQQGEVFDTVVREAIGAALELVWVIEYGDSLSPTS